LELRKEFDGLDAFSILMQIEEEYGRDEVSNFGTL